jgi:hypothetical protein
MTVMKKDFLIVEVVLALAAHFRNYPRLQEPMEQGCSQGYYRLGRLVKSRHPARHFL